MPSSQSPTEPGVIGVTDGGTGVRVPHFFSFAARERRGGYVGRRSFVPPTFRNDRSYANVRSLEKFQFSS
jgi:hypothetical protein